MSRPLRKLAQPATDFLQHRFDELVARTDAMERELRELRTLLQECHAAIMATNHRSLVLDEVGPRLGVLDEVGHRLESLDQINHRLHNVEETATDSAISARADADAVQVLAMVLERTLRDVLAQLEDQRDRHDGDAHVTGG